MLLIQINNGRQKHEVRHRTGPLYLGRLPRADGESIVVDDPYISRDQLEIEELPNDQLRLLNRGSNTIRPFGSASMSKGETRTFNLPIRFTAGQTSFEVFSTTSDELDSAMATAEPLDYDSREAADLAKVTLSNIADYYPFPLACGFRLVNSITTPSERYVEQLRLAENVLAFLANVSLALLDDQQMDGLRQKSDESVLKYWQGGISPGDWLTLAIHAAQQLEEVDTPIARGLVNLRLNKGKRGLGKIVRDLIKAKNDHKHDRGPSIESDYREATRDVGAQLNEAYNFLSFLTVHRILLVQDVNPRRRSQETDVVFLSCMGDHPGFATEQSVYSGNLRKGDLYLEREPDQLVPLYPFLHTTTCPQCKAREFYFIDRLDQSRRAADAGCTAGLKSFDRGHTVSDDEIGREMQELFGNSNSA